VLDDEDEIARLHALLSTMLVGYVMPFVGWTRRVTLGGVVRRTAAPASCVG
jgi:hypothetical protein